MNLPFPRPPVALASFLAPAIAQDGVRLALGPAGDDYHALVALSDATLEQWLAETTQLYEGMDLKTQAAMLVGYLVWDLAQAFAAMQMCGVGVPDLDPRQIQARFEWIDAPTGRQLVAPIAICNDGRPNGRLNARGIAALLEHSLNPLIEQLHVRSRLSRSALWRLVGDAIGAGWLSIGKQAGMAERAMREAEAILGAPGASFGNKQIGFMQVAACAADDPHTVVASDWYRRRGGCCRYYKTTTGNGQYCSTCVLRSPESMHEILADWMREQALLRS